MSSAHRVCLSPYWTYISYICLKTLHLLPNPPSSGTSDPFKVPQTWGIQGATRPRTSATRFVSQ